MCPALGDDRSAVKEKIIHNGDASKPKKTGEPWRAAVEKRQQGFERRTSEPAKTSGRPDPTN
jgi:hypothetical protein